jgi:hypothetical protein
VRRPNARPPVASASDCRQLEHVRFTPALELPAIHSRQFILDRSFHYS